MTPLRPDPYSKKGTLVNSDFLNCQPSRGGYIVSLRGEYMGYARKLKSGWKIEPHGGMGGRQDHVIREATGLIDAYHVRSGSARASRARFTRRGR